MIPLPQLVVEFILGLGVALSGANLVVVVRERRRSDTSQRGTTSYRRSTSVRTGASRSGPSMRRVWGNIAIGVAVAAWAAVTLLARA